MTHTIAVYHPDLLDDYLGLLRERIPSANYLPCYDAETAMEALPDAEILISNNSFPVSTLEHAQRLEWVQVMAAGVDPWLPALPNRVRLSRITGSFGPRMAEYAIGYAFAVTQRMPQVFRQQAAKQWRPLALSTVAGKTVGVAGLGSIGSAVAELGKRVGARVIGLSNTRPTSDELDTWFPADQLRSFLAEADFVVLTLPLTEQTKHIIDADALNAMKPDGWLINLARGPLVDEVALVEGLNAGQPAGAVLDVFESEPLAEDSPLWEMSNVIVTPHHSGSTIPAEVVDVFEENLSRFQQGERLLHEIDRSRGY